MVSVVDLSIKVSYTKYTVISGVFVEQAKPVVPGKGDDFQTVVPRAASQGQHFKMSARMANII